MKIETKLSCGDKAFVLSGNYGDGPIGTVTIGQVRVQVTDTPGVDGEIDGIEARTFHNYAEQTGYEEVYMALETGIGSGRLYTYGEHIFATMEEAEVGKAAMQQRYKDEIAKRNEWNREQRERDIAHHRRALAELEAASATK